MSFAFLGKERRRGLTAVYAFCRVVDDAVDDCADLADGADRLGRWRDELAAVYDGEPSTEVGRALQLAARRFGIPRQALEDVVEGMAMDLEPQTYPTPEALERYCYHAASAVGLACLPVFGARGAAAEGYAQQLGQALQWTNILRDVREDAEGGRVYLPQDWVGEFGLSLDDLAGRGAAATYERGGPADGLHARCVERARGYFGAARAQRPPEFRRELLPARIMGAVYGDLLDRLEQRGGDVRLPRVRVGRRRKLWLAMRTWLGRR